MTDAEERFVERMGRHFESDGIARIGGRLFGILLLQEEPRSLDELAEMLQVSKASVSANARLLDEWGLIQRVTRPGDRRDYYEASPDQVRMLELRLRRVREMMGLLAEGAEACGRRRGRARERLETMRQFNEDVLARLQTFLGSWTSRKN